MSTLYVDTINEKTSGNGIQIPGHVVQVVTGSDNGATITTTSSSFTDSGFSASITPKYSNSKIIISCTFTSTSTNGTQSGSGTQYKIYRSINGASDEALSVFPTNGFLTYDYNTGYNHVGTSYTVTDEPATTSSVEYSLYFAKQNTGTASIQRDWGGMHIQLMEIAQ